MERTRRELFTIVASLSGAALLLTACDDPADAGSGEDRCSSDIAFNHGHELHLTTAAAEAGASATTPTTLHIKGTSSHDHEVTLTPADFERLLSGDPVTVTSSQVSAHTHVVTVSCAV